MLEREEEEEPVGRGLDLVEEEEEAFGGVVVEEMVVVVWSEEVLKEEGRVEGAEEVTIPLLASFLPRPPPSPSAVASSRVKLPSPSPPIPPKPNPRAEFDSSAIDLSPVGVLI